jgi:hypothetical protein
MRIFYHIILLAFLTSVGSGCRTAHEVAADSITVHFVLKQVRPKSDPIAILAHDGAEIPQSLLVSNRVTLVEVISRDGQRRTVYENDAICPPTDGGMITGVEATPKIGLFYPASLKQPEIEVRANYYCELGHSVAVQLVVLNPLVSPR